MQIIKPERKYIKYQKLLKESDFKLHFRFNFARLSRLL